MADYPTESADDHEAAMVEELRALFVGREDSYLEEGIGCVKRRLVNQDFVDHLRGVRRIGPYSLLRTDSGVNAKFLCLDFDGKKRVDGRTEALLLANRAAGVLEDLGLATYLEVSRSGEGYHLWVFHGANPVALERTQRLGFLVKQLAELPQGTEVFPKGQLDDPYGGTPYLPWWGLLRGNVAACVFVNRDGSVIDGQDALLSEVTCVTGKQIDEAVREAEQRLGDRVLIRDQVREQSSSGENWVAQALEGVSENTPGRNTTAASLAGYLRKRVPLNVALSILRPWADRCLPPMPPDELERTVVGVYHRYGEESPRVKLWTPSTLDGVVHPDAGKVNFLVQDLLPAGELTIINAAWKTGKTILSYRIPLDVVTGTDVWGHYAVKEQVNVAIFQLEMPSAEDERRFRRLAIGTGLDPQTVVDYVKQGRLTVYNRPDMNLTTLDDVELFHDTVQSTGARLVIVDSLLAAFPGANLNDNSEMRLHLTRAFHSLTSGGVAVLLLHHKRKQQAGKGRDDERAAMLGAQVIGGASGRVYSLDRVGEPDEKDPTAFKVRLSLTGSWTPGADRAAILLVEDVTDPEFGEGTTVRVIGEDEQIRSGGVTKKQKAALAFAKLVQEHRRIGQSFAVKRVQGDADVSERTAKDGLKEALQRGWVKQVPLEGGKHCENELVPGPKLEEPPV